MENMGYTFTNNTSHPEVFPFYCTVLDCGELLGAVTVLPYATVIVPEAICQAPRVMQRHTTQDRKVKP